MPSDREQAALEKTNIYSFKRELAQAVSYDWRLVHPHGMDTTGGTMGDRQMSLRTLAPGMRQGI